MNGNLKPSDFCTYPWNSRFQKSENEVIALNIMKILQRTGNEFRDLSWEEYKEERTKDGNFSSREKKYFEESVKYCTAEKAQSFSSSWRKK